MKINKLISSSVVLSLTVLVSAPAFAEDSTVHFTKKGVQPVFCEAANANASVTLSTHRVEAQGFCPTGSVVLDGQTKATQVNTYYFEVKPDSLNNPYFQASSSNGAINCALGTGAGREEFRPGQGFCLAHK